MPDSNAPLRLGALCWNQYAEWPAFLAAQQQADRLGYDSLWTWDHLYPIVGSANGPILEGYTAMTGVAATTSRATVGLMVGANTFRNPAVTAKIATALDHVSGGRAVLGIGAAWFQTEHRAYGLPYGDGAPERLRWLGQALPIIRGMLDGTEPSAQDGIYEATRVRNDPPPVQRRLPLLVGGAGRKVTLKLVARYADACNVGGSPTDVRDADEALVRHCEAVGRDEREIERTTGLGVSVIRDSRDEATRVFESMFKHNGDAKPWTNQAMGTPEDVVEHIEPYLKLGYRHLIVGVPPPFDVETMVRFQQEVRPKLEALM